MRFWIPLLCSALNCFGQVFSLNDPAFMNQVAGAYVAPNLTIANSQTVTLMAGGTYTYSAINIANGGTLSIVNSGNTPVWTQITCSSLTMVSGAAIKADQFAYFGTGSSSSITLSASGTYAGGTYSFNYPTAPLGNSGSDPTFTTDSANGSGGSGARTGGGGGQAGNAGYAYGGGGYQNNIFSQNATNGFVNGGSGGWAVSYDLYGSNPGQAPGGPPNLTAGGVGGSPAILTGSFASEVDAGGGAGGSGGLSSGSLFLLITSSTSISGGTISVAGQAGGAGGAGGSVVATSASNAGGVNAGGGGGGGGGGHGGKLVVRYHGTAPTWTVSATAGAGGAGGTWGTATVQSGSAAALDGSAGMAGSAGTAQTTDIASF